MNIYETRRLLDEYLLFHYGSAEELLPWQFGPSSALDFAKRTVTELLAKELLPASGATALDLGCAVGRSSFELAAQGCSEVLGIDYSQSFVDAAAELATGKILPYERLEEAGVKTQLQAKASLPAVSSKIRFEQADAMHLPADLGRFDVVHAANLLCRLTHPQKLLQRLPDLVKRGGQLLLTTPCTWLAEFTPPAQWPAGSTFEWLKQQLEPHFELRERRDMPFLIRETARKYQWTVALGTQWQRR
jgi:putative 4-mercaptohistidine N1-methyltranferase